jgi:putative CocE/NonD family hydrolase
LVAHPNYDKFWRDRDILPHLSDVAPAVMTVGGWFDAEDLYGPLKIYESVEKKNPDVFNMLVMGPWRHGGWSRTDGDLLGDVAFGAKTSRFYQEEVERRFFGHFLRGEGELDLPEALVFETGSNEWRSFDAWPPATATPGALFFGGDGTLTAAAPTRGKARDRFVSDPDLPVPFTEDVATGMTREYMTDDQRFASRRPDVLTYQSAPLEEGMTLAGPIQAELWVTTDHEDADWIVKLIDVFPDDAKDHEFLSEGQHMSGYQMMVRSEVLRGRFRNSPANPEPFKPGEPTRVTVELQDVLHRFEPGHRIMVQVQSTWFPLVDRNPQRWVDNIFEATQDDFEAATHEVLRERAHPSTLRFSTVPEQSATP